MAPLGYFFTLSGVKIGHFTQKFAKYFARKFSTIYEGPYCLCQKCIISATWYCEQSILSGSIARRFSQLVSRHFVSW